MLCADGTFKELDMISRTGRLLNNNLDKNRQFFYRFPVRGNGIVSLEYLLIVGLIFYNSVGLAHRK
jgi:hypothetical protein